MKTRAELVAELSKLETLFMWLYKEGTLEERNVIREKALKVEKELDMMDAR